MKSNWFISSRTAATALALAYGAFHPPVAYACRCGQLSFQDAVKQAKVIFAGRVITPNPPRGMSDTPVEFEVSEVWKGTVQSRIVVVAGGSCDFEFDAGVEYLVYEWLSELPSTSPGAIRTSYCTRTRRLIDAKEDLAALGAGARPGHRPPWRLTTRHSLIWGAVLITFLLIAIGIFRTRKRRGSGVA